MSEARVLFLLLVMSESCQNAINYKTHRSEIISDSSQGSINYKYKYSKIVCYSSRSLFFFSFYLKGFWKYTPHYYKKKCCPSHFEDFLSLLLSYGITGKSNQVKSRKQNGFYDDNYGLSLHYSEESVHHFLYWSKNGMIKTNLD